ncbi:NADP-dependent oxidoreductase [Pseudodonghicola flavimaris]|uniref:NADP-dependent oxidoreductase n=1 Tax=Pseudodonghicola flavimaris TaxID=3050036 RepID=A0ABT7EXQ8_9RHOB|nr:NADP-dependent oxidoreductase [Pseudodonghicola flavimaris]MDK3017060.1 NADP-dependent oxidoreductase [Pseudodonghicola flavimaris]
MKAVRYARHGGPEVLELMEQPMPVPGPGEVLVEMRAVSANPVDGKLRAGALGAVAGGVDLPAGTGRDGAGIVRGLGAGVDPALLGRMVCLLAPRGQATWAEAVTVPAADLALVPDGVSPAVAAALPLAGICAWRALVDVAGLRPGQRVLIQAGAGGVGHLAVQLAHHLGAEVIATASAANRDFVLSLGADRVVAYDQADFAAELSGLDVVYDLVGGAVHLASATVLRPGGLLVYLNAAPFDAGALRGDIRHALVQIAPDPVAMAGMLELVARGAIRSELTRLPFADFARAQQLSDAGHSRGKIVLELPDPETRP